MRKVNKYQRGIFAKKLGSHFQPLGVTALPHSIPNTWHKETQIESNKQIRRTISKSGSIQRRSLWHQWKEFKQRCWLHKYPVVGGCYQKLVTYGKHLKTNNAFLKETRLSPQPPRDYYSATAVSLNEWMVQTDWDNQELNIGKQWNNSIP